MRVPAAKPLVHLWHLGTRRYEPVLRLQEKLVEHLASTTRAGGRGQNVLLVVEHHPVYTTGVRTQGYGAEEEARLRALGADFARTKRGGLITFHGPGQLVCYPILDLAQFAPQSWQRKALLGMKWYIHELEQVVIDLCAHSGLEASRSPHTGVWIGDRKVCAMGVRNSGFLTSHGLALNCHTDLSWFDHIVPCGIADKGVTSLSHELGRHVTPEEVWPEWVRCFERRLGCQVVGHLDRAPPLAEACPLIEP